MDAVLRRRVFRAPLPVAGSLVATQLSVGREHTCALEDTGDLYCWGFSYAGELGGNEEHTHNLVPVRVAGDHEWALVDTGIVFACALTTAGTACCWGRDMWGQLGTGTADAGDLPTPTAVAGGHTFAGISAGGGHACAWTPDGTGTAGVHASRLVKPAVLERRDAPTHPRRTTTGKLLCELIRFAS